MTTPLLASLRQTVRVLTLSLLVLHTVGCAGNSATRASGDPLLDLRNPALSVVDRSSAASIAWGEVETGVRERERARATFKDLAWSRQTAPLLRAQLVDHLMSDQDPVGEADSIRLAQLMLPSETNPRVVAVICHVAASRGWTTLTPALVRSLAGDSLRVEFNDRPEVFALTRLYPDTPIETVVFEVFLDPGEDPTDRQAAVLRWTERVRSDAWELLSSLDTDRRLRPDLIASAAQRAQGLSPESAQLVADLSDAWQRVRTLPETAMELKWFRSIRHPEHPDSAAPNEKWWGEVAQAIASRPAVHTDGLRLRHLEPIRWAARFEPDLINADRASLLATLDARLAGRDRNIRTKELGSASRRKERLRDWAQRLSWADLLSIIVTDLAVQSPQLIASIDQYVVLDQRDRTTEYGGSFEPIALEDRDFRAVLFRPRQAQRLGDNAFVVSDDLLRFSDRSLAHFHMHVQHVSNEAYAGPSFADLEYAKRSGRTCVVLTSISKERLGVDLYQPGGAVIDLGEIRRNSP
ncbi:MAG: hypothetical protein ACI89L_000275 [Phycisphaerales bacterium]|jgi:hypothetical protein